MNGYDHIPQSHVTKSVDVAYEWLMQGKILAYPTESVWGLGSHPFDEQAINRLLALKKRPTNKGMIVLTSDESYIEVFFKNLSKARQDQIIKSWYANDRRQASTWLFDIPKGVDVPRSVRGEHESLGIRVIHHPKIAALCDLFAANDTGNPFGFLLSTSCNIGGQAPARDFFMAWDYFGDGVYYLLGDTLGYDKPSQIINANTGEVVR